MKKLVSITLLTLFIGTALQFNAAPAQAVTSGFQYTWKVQTDPTKCGGSTTSNFAFEFSLSNQVLEDVAHGGSISNSSANDVVFSSALPATSANYIPWEITSYDNANGVINGFFKGTCNSSTTQTYYLSAGNSSITTAQNTGSNSSSSVWSNALAVYHMPNGTTLQSPSPDSSANGYNATLTGTPPPVATTSIIGGSGAFFDGSNSSLNGGNQNALSSSGNTVMAWVNTTGCVNGHGKFIVETNGGSGISFRLNNTNCQPYYEYDGATGGTYRFWAANNNSISANSWHLLVGTFDGTTINFYIDGVAGSGSQTNNGSPDTYASGGNTSVGWRNGFGTADWHWAGDLVDVRLYNRIMSSAEVSSTYQNAITPGNIGQAGFLTYTLVSAPTHTSFLSGGRAWIRNFQQSVAAGLLTTPTIVGTTTQLKNNSCCTSLGGDTNTWTGWSKSSGTFSGGKIIGGSNDGLGNPCGGGNVFLNELSVYDASTTTNTALVCNNALTSFGTQSQTSTISGETGSYTWKGYGPFFINDTMYYNVYRQDLSNLPHASGLIISPDHGAHWCNYTTYTNAGNTCTSSNWGATGNAPTSTAALEWPVGQDGSLTNLMSQLVLVQTCQANTVNCPVIQGFDTSYVYLLGTIMNGTTAVGSGIHRFKKTSDPMASSSWQHWDGVKWNSDYTQTAKVYDSVANGCAMHGAMYSPEVKMFLGFCEDDNVNHTNKVFVSNDLIHWFPSVTISNPNFFAEWFNPIIGLRRASGTDIIYPFASNDNSTYSLIFQNVDFGVDRSRTTVN
jgi:hypothetical protein